MKAEVLLKMANLPFETDTGGFNKAPKGKLPYITDDGEIIADSTLIRLHIEKKYGFDFDAGLSLPERGIAWAFEKVCEDHLYWAGLHAGWLVDENFDKGPRKFFNAVPGPLRPFIVLMTRRRVRRNLWGHGMGRHTMAEMDQLAARDIDAIADSEAVSHGRGPMRRRCHCLSLHGSRALPTLCDGDSNVRRAKIQPRRLSRSHDAAVFSRLCEGQDGGCLRAPASSRRIEGSPGA
jgi:hypothetical protein